MDRERAQRKARHHEKQARRATTAGEKTAHKRLARRWRKRAEE